MAQITITCKKIAKRFGVAGKEVQTLRGIDLVAHEDEILMLMGPSGSGKTTLISIIGGILKQDSGDCLVLDKDINKLSDKEKTKFRGKNIGFMFQYFNLVPTLNAIENAAIPLILNGYDRKKAFAESIKHLNIVGLDSQIYNVPKDLSGGEQQRVALVRSCIHRPKIIVCDEPTSFLDRERGRRILQLLQDIKNETHCTIIIVTHDPRILDFADHIFKIEDGFIINQDGADSIE